MAPPSPVHLISGLPRSGSTLLSALLRQNPRFHAGVSSPVCTLWGAVLPKMSGTAEFASFFTDASRYRVLTSLFQSYHGHEAGAKSVIFDTNRSWTARLALVDKLFPEARVICCVRDVPWVIDSVEVMVRRNPAHVSKVFTPKTSRTVYSRVEHLMDPDEGLIGQAWSALREAWFGEQAKKLIVIRYETLVRQPGETLERLYRELGEVPYRHDFNEVVHAEESYDQSLGMPGLHTVKRQVAFTERPTILPPDLFCKYADASFWLNEKLNTKGVLVI